MSDMLHKFVETELDQLLREKYPHVQRPAGMYARVVSVKETAGTYTYTIRLLNAAMGDDADFPEIPGVKTNIGMKQGDVAVVLLLYGGSGIFVLGRYEP